MNKKYKHRFEIIDDQIWINFNADELSEVLHWQDVYDYETCNGNGQLYYELLNALRHYRKHYN